MKPITEFDLNWYKEAHWSTSKWYYTLYREHRFKVTRESRVHRDQNGFPTNLMKEIYYIDGEEESYYKSITEVLIVLNENKNSTQ